MRTDYFKCKVKIDDNQETPIGEVYLLHLPKIGEHMHINVNKKVSNCVINDIWHFCGDDKVGHRIIIYVNEI